MYSVSSIVMRLTSTCGLRIRFKDVWQIFLGLWIRNLLLGQPCEVRGGEQLRYYFCVNDCVSAL
jgi:UDP-glucose 4-epimerase